MGLPIRTILVLLTLKAHNVVVNGQIKTNLVSIESLERGLSIGAPFV